MNRAGLEMLQADSLGQVKDRPAGPLVAPEHRRAFGELLVSVFQGRSGTLVFEMVGLKGRRLWMDTHLVPLRDESGKIIAALGITRDITERKRSEEAVKERDFWIRESQRVARLGSYVLDIPSGRWTSSEILDEIFGIDQRYDHTVSGWSGLVHPDDRERMVQYLAGIIAVKDRFAMDYRIVRKNDGQERWVSGLGELVLDARGVPVRMLGTVQDVTESKRAETALRESEQRYRQLLESITGYLYTVQVENGRAVATAHSSACLAVTGYRSDELAADPFLWYRMVHESDRSAVLAQSSLVLAGGRPDPLEHRIRHKNGRIVWVRSSLVPRQDRQGRLVAYDGLVEDITERKRSEAFVKNILETVDDGFVVIDRDLNIVTANRAYLAQSGMELGQIVGRKCYEVSHRLSGPCYEHGEDCVVRTALDSGEVRTAVHTHHDTNGKPAIVETKAYPLRGDAGEVVAAIEIIRDITERRTLEDQLRHAQKMEAVGLLAGGVAHDFNNILTAIVGYGNLLKMKTPPDDPRQAYVDQLLASTSRAAALTQSLLAFSRKQTINPRLMGVNDTLRRFERLLRRIIGEDIELRTELAPGELTILADSSQFEQVLMNLVTNARDAMPSGGSLAITTAPAVIDEDFRSSHGFGAPGSYACIAMQDSGAGMDQATLDHIFEPFFTTKELGKGAGLGLAMVYGIMKQNKGYVTVESRPGAGSRFRLYFPLVEPAPERPPDPADQALPEGHETVLVAEDDAQLRQLTATMLAEFGYTVVEAGDGEEAVRRFREHAGTVKLAILDMVMPRMNGEQARDVIMQLEPSMKVLFLSGYPVDMLREKGISSDNCIQKPISPMDLLRAVRRALDGGRGAA
jgi:PAS domain S-box-containing protein